MAVCPVDCFYAPRKASSCTTRTCASAAATASTLVRSVRRSFRRRARSACAANGQVHVLRRRTGEGQLSRGAPQVRREPSRPGKLPACAEMCSTKALLGGDGDVIADIYRQRVLKRGRGSEVWGWGTWRARATAEARSPAAQELSHAVLLVCACDDRRTRARRVRRAAVWRWCRRPASTRASRIPRPGTARSSAGSRPSGSVQSRRARRAERVRPHSIEDEAHVPQLS